MRQILKVLQILKPLSLKDLRVLPYPLDLQARRLAACHANRPPTGGFLGDPSLSALPPR